jgi:hypothetical protein
MSQDEGFGGSSAPYGRSYNLGERIAQDEASADMITKIFVGVAHAVGISAAERRTQEEHDNEYDQAWYLPRPNKHYHGSEDSLPQTCRGGLRRFMRIIGYRLERCICGTVKHEYYH